MMGELPTGLGRYPAEMRHPALRSRRTLGPLTVGFWIVGGAAMQLLVLVEAHTFIEHDQNHGPSMIPLYGVFLLVSFACGVGVYKATTPSRQTLRRLRNTRETLIFGLAKLADYRDSDTGKHLERIAEFSELLASAYEYPDDAPPPDGSIAEGPVTDDWIRVLRMASSLHDIGKVGIPDSILLKPGPLTDLERTIMQRHTEIGADTLIGISEKLGKDDMVAMGLVVALQHHERWDGGGYPMGLCGYDISLAARIVALADFYDALTSDRVYKKASTHEETRELILASRGTHFDPAVVDAFDRVHEQMRAAKERLQPAKDEVLRGVARFQQQLSEAVAEVA